ncbi:non-secretory ribonuclease-like [Carlito syrichta]|uniref:Eosinophil cationic protein n=1 Tax=Carlito syrichta TaxID=1868482 RepID=A0A3Q0DZ00_CARSF|nr:non-secretory ribonuclease-like [Carlito syrichta]
MAPKLLSSRFCLLLLLGLMGIVGSSHAKPSHVTWAQWFNIQHVNMTHSRCDDAMQVVNGYEKRCKNLNTFLHTNFSSVVSVCNTQNITCNNGRMNCHESTEQVPLTICNITRHSTNYRNCTYRQTQAQKRYIIACNNSAPQDAEYPAMVPVHLDRLT